MFKYGSLDVESHTLKTYTSSFPTELAEKSEFFINPKSFSLFVVGLKSGYHSKSIQE